MQTLFELVMDNGDVLRGILVEPPQEAHRLVIMVHGFCRSAVSEHKFKKLGDALGVRGVASLRFDFVGCGISDGDLTRMTVAYMAQQLGCIILELKEQYREIAFVAHSLGACVVAKYLHEWEARRRMIFIAPALRQNDLLRYWFGRGKPVDEAAFLEDCRQDKETRFGVVGSRFFLENMNADYTPLCEGQEILLVAGDGDHTVPINLVDVNSAQAVLVHGGDHDMEKPSQLQQWLQPAVDFLVAP